MFGFAMDGQEAHFHCNRLVLVCRCLGMLCFHDAKSFFAGLPLWAFGDYRLSLSNYYMDDDWFPVCVGHQTFHRQERKFSEEEGDRFEARVACETLSQHFAFASAPVDGPPEGVSTSLLLRHIAVYLRMFRTTRWDLDPDGPAENMDVGNEAGGFSEAWRRTRDELAEPLHLRNEVFKLLRLDNVSSTTLVGPGGHIVHTLVEAQMLLEQPSGAHCSLILRLRNLIEKSLDVQLMGAFLEPATSSIFGTQLLETAHGTVAHFDVPSCVCRQRYGTLNLQWVAEETH